MVHGEHTRSEVAVHGALSYSPAGQAPAEHKAQTRSADSVHGDTWYEPASHGPEHGQFRAGRLLPYRHDTSSLESTRDHSTTSSTSTFAANSCKLLAPITVFDTPLSNIAPASNDALDCCTPSTNNVTDTDVPLDLSTVIVTMCHSASVSGEPSLENVDDGAEVPTSRVGSPTVIDHPTLPAGAAPTCMFPSTIAYCTGDASRDLTHIDTEKLLL